MESVNFNKNQPQRIRVPAVEETFKMANKPWSTRTLCFPLSHLSCSTVFFHVLSVYVFLPFSLPDVLLSSVFVFQTRFPLQEIVYSGIIQEGREQVSCWSHGHKKEKRREEERKGWGGGVG